jgi:hypothetical protein
LGNRSWRVEALVKLSQHVCKVYLALRLIVIRVIGKWIAGIADLVEVRVFLARIELTWTVVETIKNPIAIRVRAGERSSPIGAIVRLEARPRQDSYSRSM